MLGALTGCSLGDDEDPEPPSAAAPQVIDGLATALQRRAAAVRRGDRRAFLRGLAARPELRGQQLAWFDNLAQLPLARLGYRLDPATLVRDGRAYWVVVEQRLELDGFDAEPVATRDRWQFAPVPRGGGRYRLVSVTDAGWEEQTGVRPDPWALGPVEVVAGSGVLGVFDAGSVGAAPDLVSDLEAALAEVAGLVPLDWSRSVVVHAPSGTELLRSIDDLPGNDPEEADAVAFPVWSAGAEPRLAATRIVLHPSLLDAPGRQRDRLLRHELVHVAVGARDDEAPLWLGEGLAEYLSVRPLAPQDRVVSGPALEAARLGVDGLPRDEDFVPGRAATSYGLAWWACEYLARNYGEPVLWWLLEELGRAGADQDAVLRQRFGLDGDELAEAGAELMLATYDAT